MLGSVFLIFFYTLSYITTILLVNMIFHVVLVNPDFPLFFSITQFAPTYHDYVLYNHSEGEDGAKKYRARTFVPTGPEMDTVRKNKHMFGNKLDDIQLASLSSSGSNTPQNSGPVQNTAKSEAMDSSLLMDASNSLSVPYDLSLIEVDMSNYPANVPPANEAGTR